MISGELSTFRGVRAGEREGARGPVGGLGCAAFRARAAEWPQFRPLDHPLPAHSPPWPRHHAPLLSSIWPVSPPFSVLLPISYHPRTFYLLSRTRVGRHPLLREVAQQAFLWRGMYAQSRGVGPRGTRAASGVWGRVILRGGGGGPGAERRPSQRRPDSKDFRARGQSLGLSSRGIKGRRARSGSSAFSANSDDTTARGCFRPRFGSCRCCRRSFVSRPYCGRARASAGTSSRRRMQPCQRLHLHQQLHPSTRKNSAENGP